MYFLEFVVIVQMLFELLYAIVASLLLQHRQRAFQLVVQILFLLSKGLQMRQ